ncbi:MAG: hypothetical protein ACLU99_14695 [Alphaproteobacteria bacterium]
MKTYELPPATKRFARDLMLEGKTLEELLNQNIAKKNKKSKRAGDRAMLREMSDRRL